MDWIENITVKGKKKIFTCFLRPVNYGILITEKINVKCVFRRACESLGIFKDLKLWRSGRMSIKLSSFHETTMKTVP